LYNKNILIRSNKNIFKYLYFFITCVARANNMLEKMSIINENINYDL